MIAGPLSVFADASGAKPATSYPPTALRPRATRCAPAGAGPCVRARGRGETLHETLAPTRGVGVGEWGSERKRCQPLRDMCLDVGLRFGQPESLGHLRAQNRRPRRSWTWRRVLRGTAPRGPGASSRALPKRAQHHCANAGGWRAKRGNAASKGASGHAGSRCQSVVACRQGATWGEASAKCWTALHRCWPRQASARPGGSPKSAAQKASGSSFRPARALATAPASQVPGRSGGSSRDLPHPLSCDEPQPEDKGRPPDPGPACSPMLPNLRRCCPISVPCRLTLIQIPKSCPNVETTSGHIRLQSANFGVCPPTCGAQPDIAGTNKHDISEDL